MSVLFVPLIVGGEATGRISLQNLDHEHAFSEADLRLLTTLAGSLSVALENARLFEETRQRNAELALINDVQRGLAENLEMHAMYDLVGDRLHEIFDAQVIDIGILDRETGLLHSRTCSSVASATRTSRRPSRRARRYVIDTGEPLVINERFTGASYELGERRRRTGETPMSGVYVPLVVGGERPAGSRCRTSTASTRSARQTSPSHDARRQPQRRARERAVVRGDTATQRRARAHQRRAARAGREPRDAGDVRPRRRAHRQIFDAQTVDIGVVDEAADRSGSRTRSSVANG